MKPRLDESQKKHFNQVIGRVGERLQSLSYRDLQVGQFLSDQEAMELKEMMEEMQSVCLAMVPDHWPSMVFVADLHHRLGESAEALELLERVCRIETTSHLIPMEASIIAAGLEDIDKTIYYSGEAVSRKSNDPALLANYAMNLLLVSRDEEARKYIEQALWVDPFDPISQEIAGVINEVISGRCERPTLKDTIPR